jgi:hypothetical protein
MNSNIPVNLLIQFLTKVPMIMAKSVIHKSSILIACWVFSCGVKTYSLMICSG